MPRTRHLIEVGVAAGCAFAMHRRDDPAGDLISGRTGPRVPTASAAQ
jgi:hypothetical protein